MADYCFYGAQFIVLHYWHGQLAGVKLCETMRGAKASKRYHEKHVNIASKIVDVELLKGLAGEGVLPMSAADAELLRGMGVAF